MPSYHPPDPMTATSTFWRAVLKWPRWQRLEVLEVPALGVRAVQVPKAGSGTIRMTVLRGLRDRAGTDLPKEALWRYVRFVAPEDLAGRQPPCFTFGFGRDPYARLVSCYRHKIERPRQQGKKAVPHLLGLRPGLLPADGLPRFRAGGGRRPRRARREALPQPDPLPVP